MENGAFGASALADVPEGLAYSDACEQLIESGFPKILFKAFADCEVRNCERGKPLSKYPASLGMLVCFMSAIT